MNGTWQSALALDVRFNGARFNHCGGSFKNWYLRRRSQLLRECDRSPTEVSWYLTERKRLLRAQYGKHPIGTANSQWSQDSSRIADFDAIEEDYAFAGMAHIFDQHIGSAVTCLAFARRSRSLLALGSADGSISICSLDQEPQVDKVLDARAGPISRLEWSSNNEFMVTASQTGLSGKLIVWRVESGERLRQFEWNKSCNSKLGFLNLASFHSMNSNFVVFGGTVIYSMNISTGQCVKLLDAKISLNSLDFTANGRYLFIGDQQGGLGMFRTDANLSNLTKIRRFLIAPNTRISNISVCSIERAFYVLISTNESLMLFAVTDPSNSAPIIKMINRWSIRTQTLKTEPISPMGHNGHTFFDIRAEFCPLSIIHDQVASTTLSIVSGSKSGSVLFFTSKCDQPINALQGHERGVLAATFNYDESLLATSDENGVVIIWKRQ